MKLNKIYNMDCLEGMKQLEDNSIDAIVTDPPYGLFFMNKKWDYGIPKVEIWQECLRVLKPGAMLLSFAGTRTQHRMACNIEDAGFEIRDMIAWVYGSGFPKSLNVGKAIDKLNGRTRKDFIELGNYLKEKRGKDYSKKELGMKIFKFNSNREDVPIHTFESGKDIPTQKIYNKLKKILKLDTRFDELIKRIEAKREIIDKKKKLNAYSNLGYSAGEGNYNKTEIKITKPATPEAIKWNGWGTALKPAFEPITVARKPLSEKTVAENVLKWGTGGINIDGCRVTYKDTKERDFVSKRSGTSLNQNKIYGKGMGFRDGYFNSNPQGRFPANFIHDGSKEVLKGFPKTANSNPTKRKRTVLGSFGMPNDNTPEYSDKGTASRFFYCAKASKSEREKHLLRMIPCPICHNFNTTEHQKRDIDSKLELKNEKPIIEKCHRNNHPTVKPLKLMEYLIKLVSTKNAIILDPFIGSGTTALACINLQRNFIGFELEKEYCDIAEARLKPWREQKRIGIFEESKEDGK